MSVTGDGLNPIVSELISMQQEMGKLPRAVWATVVQQTPLRIIVDGDTLPMAGRPAQTSPAPAAGTRVLCLMQNGRATVIGTAYQQEMPEVDQNAARAVFGTPLRGGNLAHLRESILGNTNRCVVVTVGSSTFRAQEARIGATERLAYRAGASSFPLLDDLTARPATNAGMVWLQGAEGGTRAENYLPEARLQKIALAAPNYVIHSIGSSDYAAQRPLESYKTWMRNAVERIEADTPGVVNVLVHQQARPDYPNMPVPWEAYGEALKEVADEVPSRVFIDINSMLDLYTIGIPGNRHGLVRVADNVHPSNQGHKVIADVLGNALGIPTMEPRTPEIHEFEWSNGSHTAGFVLASHQLHPVAYPRLVRMEASIRYRASVGDNSTNYWELQLGKTNDFVSHRPIGDSVNASATMVKTVYVAPMEEATLTLRGVRFGTTTFVVTSRTSADNELSIVETPY